MTTNTASSTCSNKYDGQGRKMSHKVNANNYAPKIFAAEKNGITAKPV